MSAKVPTGPIRIWRSDLPTPIDPRDPRTPTLADVAPTDITLVGHTATLDISDRVLNVKPIRTVDGASTLAVTVSDPDLVILNSEAIRGRGDGNLYSLAIIDSLVFQLVGIKTAPRRTTLTLEAEAIHRLRRQSGAYSLRRGTVTRAAFILQLCRMAGVELYCPELNVTQRIQTVENALTQAQKDRRRTPGFRAGVHLTIKGRQATRQQLDILSRLLTVAHEVKASMLPTLAMICSTIGESTVSFEVNSLGYGGPLQAHKDAIKPTDVEQQGHYFLMGGKGFNEGGAIALSKTVSDPGEIATRVETSGQPGSFYGQHRAEAAAIIAAFNGGSLTDPLTTTETYAKPYQFKRLKKEDSWTCMRRLADEVGWHLFEVAGTVYFMSPGQLKMSRPRMLVAPNAAGIIEVNVDYDTSPKADNQIRVICEAARWAAPPGSVAEVQGYGPVDGRWLVHDIARDSLASVRTAITLSRFKRKLEEPAHDTATRAPKNPSITPASDPSQLANSGGLARPVVTNLASDTNGWTGAGGHDGIDLICAANAPIYAICDARVVDVRSGGWWGKSPTGDVTKGDGIIQIECTVNIGPFKAGMRFGYGHAEGAVVSVGDTVKAGQRLGHAGFANAWHVHFMAHTGPTGTGRPQGVGNIDPKPFVVYATQYKGKVGTG